jgi:hypothetical protein
MSGIKDGLQWRHSRQRHPVFRYRIRYINGRWTAQEWRHNGYAWTISYTQSADNYTGAVVASIDMRGWRSSTLSDHDYTLRSLGTF